MRIKIGSGLLLLNLLVIALVAAIILLPSNVLRIILGLPFTLFFPGYVLLVALFPKREGMGGIERVALSFGLSIVVVPLIGLIFNYTSWGITLESMLYSVASFMLLLSIIATVRRNRLPEEERFIIDFQIRWIGRGEGVWGKALSVVLVIAILGALGTLGYVIAKPKVGERFTEFYILGTEGKATGYPTELRVGEEGKVIVGIINQEHESKRYYVEVVIDGVKDNKVGPIALEQDEKWEEAIGFTPNEQGEDQKVEFLLYKDIESEPSMESLRLWIDVTE